MSAKRTNVQDMKAIRHAVCMHRGGWQHADDAAIRRVWGSLPPETQQQYLKAAEAGEKPATTRKAAKPAASPKPQAPAQPAKESKPDADRDGPKPADAGGAQG